MPTTILRSILHPLDEFYEALGRPVPQYELLAAEALPEPYRSLLHHQHDMTPTLATHHQAPIALRVLERRREPGSLARLVTLHNAHTGAPVEFGAIVIYLGPFPEGARQAILACSEPLGSILAAHRVPHTSTPRAFYRLTSDPLMARALRCPVGTVLYGRRNVHLTAGGAVLAEVVEILPPGRG